MVEVLTGEKSRTTSLPAATSSSSWARRSASISSRTSGGSGTLEIPRRHISTSKESRTNPSLSSRRAYVDLPDPDGPHMNRTRLTDGP